MTLNPFSGNVASPTVMIDELIGTAFPIVRTVAENIEFIKHVSANLADLYTLFEYIDELEEIRIHLPELGVIANNIDGLVAIAENIDDLLVITANMPALLVISNDMDELLAAADYIEGVIDEFGSLENAVNIATTAATTATAAAAATEADKNQTHADAVQTASDRAAVTAALASQPVISADSWTGQSTSLDQRTPTVIGQRATVSLNDVGTHTGRSAASPSVAVAGVANSGIYGGYALTVGAWRWDGALNATGLASRAVTQAGISTTEATTPDSIKYTLDDRLTGQERKETIRAATLPANTPGTLRPYAPHPFAIKYNETAIALGSVSMTESELNRLSRFYDVIDREGILQANMNYGIGYIFAKNETRWRINIFNPGTYTLTKVGNPTYTPNLNSVHQSVRGVFCPTNADYWDTGFQANNLDPLDTTLWASVPSNAVASNGFEFGDRLAEFCILTRITGSFLPTGRIRGAGGGSSNTDAWTGSGMHHVTRRNDANMEVGHYGNNIDLPTSALIAKVASPYNMRIGQAAAASPVASGNYITAAMATRAGTTRQNQFLAAAVQEYYFSQIYGEPMIYPRGVGPRTLHYDAVIYGLGFPSMEAAIVCKQRGLTVCLVGDWNDQTIWDVGGMPVNGLCFMDINGTPTYIDKTVTGLWAQIYNWINVTFYNRTNTRDQAGLSVEPRAISAAVRHLLDGTRDESIIPSLKIPIYMTGGICGTTKSGTEIKSIQTRDGRTFHGSYFGLGDYDGDGVYYAGIPYRIGRAAPGPAKEAKSGYLGIAGVSQVNVDSDPAKPVFIDPWRIPGNSASGRCLNLSTVRGLTVGGPDPAVQALNIRATIRNDEQRYAPMNDGMPLPITPAGIPTIPPENYSLARYELVGRHVAAWELADGGTPATWGDFVDLSNVTAGCRDMNGKGILSMDMPGSGEAYAAAGTDIDARRAVWIDTRNWMQGWFYFMIASGDPRINAGLIASYSNFKLDALNHLDPGDWGKLYIPNQAYRREPIFKMINSLLIDANDVGATNNTIYPIRDDRTISQGSYSFDAHHTRLDINAAGWVGSVGGVGTSIIGGGAGGTDGIFTWPLGASVADIDVCTNAVVMTNGAFSSFAWAPMRMESFMAQAGETLGHVIAQAFKDSTSVQEVNYDAVRTSVQGSGYTWINPLQRIN